MRELYVKADNLSYQQGQSVTSREPIALFVDSQKYNYLFPALYMDS